MKYIDDTICACATSGSGAISVIRVCGPDTFAVTDKVIALKSGAVSTCSGYSLRFGKFHSLGHPEEEIDEVLVSIFRNPHSYTGEDSVEISCHASGYIVKSILENLVRSGARMAEPGEFTRRAFLGGKMDLAQAEAVADLIAAQSEAAHRVAVSQLKGEYSGELRTLRNKLLELTALLELELDFGDEEVEFADRAALYSLLDESLAHIDRLASSFSDGNAVKNGIPVAIVGEVNSGKSTLLNALIGEERAIVSDIPGTTRDTIEETMTIDGLLYRFIDTAGLRQTEDTIEKIGIIRAWQKLSEADVVIALLDGTVPSTESAGTLTEISSRLEPHQTLVAVTNKTDLSPALDGTLGISARTGAGIDDLKKAVAASQAGRFSQDNTLVTNLRHYEALVRAAENLRTVREGLDTSLLTDLVAEDLRAAISELNSIFGDSMPASESVASSSAALSGTSSSGTAATASVIDFKAITDLIFSRFCIGK